MNALITPLRKAIAFDWLVLSIVTFLVVYVFLSPLAVRHAVGSKNAALLRVVRPISYAFRTPLRTPLKHYFRLFGVEPLGRAGWQVSTPGLPPPSSSLSPYE
jgi:hypothetical protein